MTITFSFDERSKDWERGNAGYNRLLTKAQLQYLEDIYKYRGYMYLSTIYEAFKLVWDPYQDNICWILDRDGDLEMTYTDLQDKSKRIDICVASK